MNIAGAKTGQAERVGGSTGAEEASSQLQEYQARESAFDEMFGQDLGEFARAYLHGFANSVFQIDEEIFITRRNRSYTKDELRANFVNALTEALSEQPEERKADWLNSFFRVLDQLVPNRAPQRQTTF